MTNPVQGMLNDHGGVIISGMIFLSAAFLTGALALSPPPAAPTAQTIFRLDIAGQQTLWSKDRPVQSGGLILFHRYPDGALCSIRRADVIRIVASSREQAARRLKPGDVIELGPTGEGAGSARPAARGPAAGSKPPGLGERPDGTALFNPDRPYRPDWDSKRVPGLSYPYPASANDYREGRTLGYPPAPSVQSAPGDVPRARTETGEPPKAPNQ